jgi:general stress protein YciG
MTRTYYDALTRTEQKKFAVAYEQLREQEAEHDASDEEKDFPFLKLLSKRTGFDQEQTFRIALDYANIKRERNAQAERGRKGGAVSSDAKTEAARENGRKGGRPKNS